MRIYLDFDAFEEHHDRVHDVGRQVGFLRSRIRFPATDFGKNQFDENRQRTASYGVGNHSPLVIGQITTTVLHPMSEIINRIIK